MESFTRDKSSGSVLNQDFDTLQKRRAAKAALRNQKEQVETLTQRVAALEYRLQLLEEKLK